MSHVNKQMLSFFLTTKCNLRCVYCYNVLERCSREEQTLDLKFAQAGVDYFFENNPSRHIRFYGPGEPTQEFGLMKQIVEYAKGKAGNALSVEVQTNGVFGPNVQRWFADNVNIAWFSFDGTPDIHDANRPLKNGKPSSPIIERNVKQLITGAADNQIFGVRATITDQNMKRQKEMIDYFSSLGVKHIWVDPLFPEVGKIPVCDNPNSTFEFDMNTFLDNFIPAYNYAEGKGIFYNSFLMCNFDGESPYHCRACTPVPHLTPDGYISACDMVTHGADPSHMEPLIYGKWNEKTGEIEFFNDRIINLQLRSTEHMKHCKGCTIANNCGGYCLGEVLNATGSLGGEIPGVCKAIHTLHKEIGSSLKPYPVFHP